MCFASNTVNVVAWLRVYAYVHWRFVGSLCEFPVLGRYQTNFKIDSTSLIRTLLHRALADSFSAHHRFSSATLLFQDSLTSAEFSLPSFLSETRHYYIKFKTE